MNKLFIKKGLLLLMTLSFSLMLNWCDVVLDILDNFQGIFAEDEIEEVIEPLPDPGPEPELADNVDLQGVTEAEFIVRMVDEMIAADVIQVVQTEDERLDEVPRYYYYDSNHHIYAEEREGVVQEYMYGTDTERVELKNPMARHINKREEELESDPEYDEKLKAADEEIGGRFIEKRWDHEYKVTTSHILLPGPKPDQIDDAEIYGDILRGELSQDYIEESLGFSSDLPNLDPDDKVHVEIEVNPQTGTITFSKHFDILNPEESETWEQARLGLENTTYEVSETDKEFPQLGDIGRMEEHEAFRILREHDLMAFYEKY